MAASSDKVGSVSKPLTKRHIMQAIQTRYLPATNFKGSRIKATCERGSITIDYPHELSGEEVHRAAVHALIARFVKEDESRYGTGRNPWARPFITGGLPGGGYCHVFVEVPQRPESNICHAAGPHAIPATNAHAIACLPVEAVDAR